LSQVKTLGQIADVNGLMTDGDWVESKDQDANGTVRLLQLADVGVCNFTNKSSRFMTEERAIELKCTFLEEGDILIARMPDPIGRACIFPGYEKKCVTVVDVCVLRVDPKEFDNRWLMYMINSSEFNHQILEFVSGTTRQRIARKKLEALGLKCPSLQTQKSIAVVLDKANQLRKDCHQMEQELSSLAQSVFIDMFGDPLTNPKGFSIRTLKEFYDSDKTGTKCGPFGSALKKEEFVDFGVPVWNMSNISLTGEFIDSPTLWITEDKYNDLQAYNVLQGDVIISRAGTVGKMGVIDTKFEKSLISTNLIRVRFGKELLPLYFVSLMTYCKTRLKRLKVGDDGSFSHMNTGILDNLEFPYPPMEVQLKYMKFRESLNHQFSCLNEINRLQESNFNSLMQKAFKGELNL
tara:strand:- start:16389 stop:17609 length:1221 start_codon:yes stop_codon:yes gene_type:complete